MTLRWRIALFVIRWGFRIAPDDPCRDMYLAAFVGISTHIKNTIAEAGR